MHCTLKRETLRPPALMARTQQARFDAFQVEFNQERPHEGIDDKTPAFLYTASKREFPSRLRAIEVPVGLIRPPVTCWARVK
jgi:putative transposase